MVPNLPLILAAANWSSPLLWAVLWFWILSVVFHEFAHGLVAYIGGDTTVRERGLLTLNPLAYIDPVFTLLIPAVVLLMGGMPLPGGRTLIDRSLLRTRGWESAMFLAGPASNLLLFLLLALPLHPAIGWMPQDIANADGMNRVQIILATLVVLQWFSVMINLIPLPPLDGYQALSPYLNPDVREKLAQPSVVFGSIFVLFFVFSRVDAVMDMMLKSFAAVMRLIGFVDISPFGMAYNRVFFSS